MDDGCAPRNYLLLIGFAALGEISPALLPHLAQACSEDPRRVWGTTTTAAIGLRSPRTARMLENHLRNGPIHGITTALILELGDDWSISGNPVAQGWLTRHLGDALA